jgi:sporulation protein YunB
LLVKSKRRKNKKRKFVIFIIFLVVAFLIFLLEKYLKPLQDRLIVNRTKVVVEDKFAEATKEVIDNNDYDYDNLLIKSDNDGSISSLSLNTKELNKLQAEFTNEFQKRIEGLTEGYIGVPLGDLTTLSFLSGMGPEIPFSYDVTGSVSIKLNSSFDTTGINQTIHRVNMEVSAEIVFITVEDTENLIINNNYEISETVIVGGIPNYTYRY